jgi:hypothetical protein
MFLYLTCGMRVRKREKRYGKKEEAEVGGRVTHFN